MSAYVDGAFYWIDEAGTGDWIVAQYDTGECDEGVDEPWWLPGVQSPVSTSDLAEIGSLIGTRPPGAEREAVVAWLRRWARVLRPGNETKAQTLDVASWEIECGRHLRPAGATDAKDG